MNVIRIQPSTDRRELVDTAKLEASPSWTAFKFGTGGNVRGQHYSIFVGKNEYGEVINAMMTSDDNTVMDALALRAVETRRLSRLVELMLKHNKAGSLRLFANALANAHKLPKPARRKRKVKANDKRISSSTDADTGGAAAQS